MKMNIKGIILALGLSIMALGCAHSQAYPPTARVEIIKMGKWLSPGETADGWDTRWDKINDNFVMLDTAQYSIKSRITALEASPGGGGSYTAGEGMTLDGTEFNWGGALTSTVEIEGTSSTNISLGTSASKINSFYVYSEGNIDIMTEDGAVTLRNTVDQNVTISQNSGDKVMRFGSGGMDIIDETDEVGLENGADYSSNATDRSLIDKAHIESLISAGGGGSTDLSGLRDTIALMSDTIRILQAALDSAVNVDTVAHMLNDIKTFSLGVGVGLAGDTVLFAAGIDIGGKEIAEDSILPQTFYLSVEGDAGDSTRVRLYHHPTEWGGSSPTTICTLGVGVTGGSQLITSFDVAILPPGFVWGEILSQTTGLKAELIRGSFGWSEKRAE